jgi:predicted nucleic acid-binding protein
LIHLDTSFLVDYLREMRRRVEGPATRFLLAHADDPLWVSVHAWCELEVGAAMTDSPQRERRRLALLKQNVEIAHPTQPQFPTLYGELAARLRDRGTQIGTMDLLIATAALVAAAPLATGNPRHFARIPDLELMPYRDA